ncbi:MAG TPA: response regulator transcription factor [Chloroflexota bacterium]|jgi:two-component system nitrate/nitrite response regulator NarL|nr:response regulator transcription factor [Chloroflexota bacterium]
MVVVQVQGIPLWQGPVEWQEAGNRRFPLRVLLVDGHTFFRQGLRTLLAGQPWLTVVGEAATLQEAADQGRRLQPTLVLIEPFLPGSGGANALQLLRAQLPDVAIVVLSISENEADICAAREAGARAYLYKTWDLARLCAALQTLATAPAPRRGKGPR